MPGSSAILKKALKPLQAGFNRVCARCIAWPDQASFPILRFNPCSGRDPAGVLLSLCPVLAAVSTREQCGAASRHLLSKIVRVTQVADDRCTTLLACEDRWTVREWQ